MNAAPQPAGPQQPGRDSIEARLLRRLLTSLGDPPIEFLFKWTGERVSTRAQGHGRAS